MAMFNSYVTNYQRVQEYTCFDINFVYVCLSQDHRSKNWTVLDNFDNSVGLKTEFLAKSHSLYLFSYASLDWFKGKFTGNHRFSH